MTDEELNYLYDQLRDLTCLCKELAEALEHHIEQTRPIEHSTIALAKYREMVK